MQSCIHIVDQLCGHKVHILSAELDSFEGAGIPPAFSARPSREDSAFAKEQR